MDGSVMRVRSAPGAWRTSRFAPPWGGQRPGQMFNGVFLLGTCLFGIAALAYGFGLNVLCAAIVAFAAGLTLISPRFAPDNKKIQTQYRIDRDRWDRQWHCEQCNKVFEDGSAAGGRPAVAHPSKWGASPSAPAFGLACPSCGSAESFLRISVVYEAEKDAWKTPGRKPDREILRRISPPAGKSAAIYPLGICALALSLLQVGTFAAWGYCMMHVSDAAAFGCLFGGTAVVLGLALLAGKIRRKLVAADNEKAADWDRHWFCRRCNSIAELC